MTKVRVVVLVLAAAMMELVAGEARAETPAATISDVQVKVRTMPFGEHKGSVYPVVAFDVTAKAPSPHGSRPIVEAVCAGDKSYSETAMAIEVVMDRLAIGTTASAEVPLFMQKPFPKGSLKSCSVTIRLSNGPFDHDGTEVGRYCYQSGKVSSGSCKG